MFRCVAQVESGLPKQPSFLERLKLIQRLNEVNPNPSSSSLLLSA